MALSDDDLKFVLQPETDVNAIAKSLTKLYATASAAGTKAGKILGDSIGKGAAKEVEGFDPLELLRRRSEAALIGEQIRKRISEYEQQQRPQVPQLPVQQPEQQIAPLVQDVIEQEQRERPQVPAPMQAERQTTEMPVDQDRLRMAEDLAKIEAERERIAERLKKLEVPDELIAAREEQERLARETAERIRLADELIEKHKKAYQGKLPTSGPASQEAADATVDKLTAEEQLETIAENRKRIEEQIVAIAWQSAEAIRERARGDLEKRLAMERMAVKEAKALADPSFAKERFKIEEDIYDLQYRRSQIEKKGRIVSPERERLKIQHQLTEELESQQKSLERQRVALDPELMRQRINLEREAAEISHRREVAEGKAKLDPDYIEQAIRRERELAAIREREQKMRQEAEARIDGGTSPEKERLKVYKEITKELEDQKKSLERQRVALDPSLMKQRLEIEKEIASLSHKEKVHRLKASMDPKDIEKEVRREKVVEKLEEKRRTMKEEIRTRVDAEDKGSKSSGGISGMLKSLFANVDIGTMIGSMLGSGMGSAIGSLMGSGAGAAALGPIGAIVGVVEELSKSAGQLYSLPFRGFNAGLRTVDKSLAGMQEQLGPVAVGFNLLSDGLGTVAAGIEKIPIVGDLLGPMAQELAAIPGVLKSIAGTLTSMAAKASPAQYRLLEMAVDDAQAVIGHTFLPVMDLFTESIRFAGDILATLLPNSSEVSDALSEMRQSLRELFADLRQAAADVGPQVREGFIAVIRGIGYAVSVVAREASNMSPVLIDLVRLGTELAELQAVLSSAEMYSAMLLLRSSLTLMNAQLRLAAFHIDMLLTPLRAIGLISGQSGPGQQVSSQGAAARQAMMVDVEEYQRQLQVAAFSQSGGPTQQQVPAMTQTMMTTLQDIYTLLDQGIGVTILRTLTPLFNNETVAPALATTGMAANAFTAGNQELLRRLRAALGF